MNLFLRCIHNPIGSFFWWSAFAPLLSLGFCLINARLSNTTHSGVCLLLRRNPHLDQERKPSCFVIVQPIFLWILHSVFSLKNGFARYKLQIQNHLLSHKSTVRNESRNENRMQEQSFYFCFTRLLFIAIIRGLLDLYSGKYGSKYRTITGFL